jgi:hypothetical protein
MTFFTITVACFVFVNVQVTVSPAATLNVAWRFATEPVEFESSQTIELRAQPSLAPSVETY